MNSLNLRKFLSFFIGLFSLLGVIVPAAFAQGPDSTAASSDNLSIYRFMIRDDINASSWRTTQQAFLKAKELDADVILIEMNTFGGLVNFADSIRSAILDSPIKTIVFINHNAASAGALISLASEKIYMAKGSSIGAASVVDGQGEVMPEKYQSYMRALMRSTAEATGRDPKVAEAFVDQDVDLPDLKEDGKLLSLTSREATNIGLSDGEVNSLDDILMLENLAGSTIVVHQTTWVDQVIGFLTSPAVQGFLIVL